MMKHRENCPMRHENGNCLPCGGFCTAVNDDICKALHSAYDKGYISCAVEHKESILPYDIGDVFYRVYPWRNEISEERVSGITKKANRTWKIRLSPKFMGVYEIELSDIGKIVFKTLEEAEKELKEIRNLNG